MNLPIMPEAKVRKLVAEIAGYLGSGQIHEVITPRVQREKIVTKILDVPRSTRVRDEVCVPADHPARASSGQTQIRDLKEVELRAAFDGEALSERGAEPVQDYLRLYGSPII
jgi:hypothetical protein